MEHVSTLCALSTVGIAATGFALGRLERRSLSSSVVRRRRNTPSQCPHPATPTDTNGPPHAGRLVTDAPINCTALGNHAQTDSGREIIGDQGSTKPVPSQRRERRRRQTYASPPTQASGDFPSKASGGRPSSSWLRRISVISSNKDRPLSSPRPTSSPLPSSMHGSIAPIIPQADQPSRAPKKLVKRPTSRHSVSNHPTGHKSRSMSAVLTLRRPAMSHQRSAEIEHLATLKTNSELPMTPAEDPRGLASSENEADEIWRPYFCSSQGEPFEKLPERLSISIRPKDQPNQLITPDPTKYPTLILSTSILPRNPKHTSGIENPGSSSHPQFHDPFQPVNDITSDNAKFPVSEEHRKSRQSFSFNDTASGGSRPRAASKTESLHSPENGPAFQAKPRNLSNPLPQRSEEILGPNRPAAPQLRRKRNFTDSSVIRRPETAPQGEFSILKSSQIRESQTNPVFPPFGVCVPTEITPSYLTGQINNGLVQRSPSNPQAPGSPLPIVRYPRIQRLSVTASDRASTVIGSDDTRIFTSGDEDETDFQSDSVFDSFRTRVTASSHSGRRGPNIETMFQDIPATEILKDKHTVFDDLVWSDSFLSPLTPQSSSSISNPNSVSTPVPVSHVRDEDETPTPFARAMPRITIPSSPSKSAEFQWAYQGGSTLIGEGKEQDVPSSPPSQEAVEIEDGELGMSPKSLPKSGLPATTSRSDDVPGLIRKTSGIGTKASVFDWSEKSERDMQNSDNRPKTVHGKEDTDARGSRGTGRRAPSAVHLRSQSVPVSRDSPPSNDGRQPTLRFGTWGLGHKGVSEDWDGDFDFGDSDDHSMDDDDGKIASGGHHHRIMKVPQAIMETQASVHGQFGQVQELTLLVEELKRLRVQGNMLRIIQGPSSELWKEAEGIVNLATVEDDENNFPPPLSPSSHISFDDFDFDSSPTQKTPKRNDSDVRRSPLSVWPNSGPNTSPPRRKDTSAKVKSVLETIYQQRESSDPHTPEFCVYPQQKLPFDTQSLRDLVVRAGVVTRALKEVIRRAEGVEPTSESPLPPDPPFSRIFEHST
ncbi:hypothetical protein VTN77DRAFT_6060 [Rasamsonia byssochlamydoides]|uniref:uncharacterized protein n=1 Tax=Rasamsonia byssochlamydoides TaxID=89139 RepID=UPI003743AF80